MFEVNTKRQSQRNSHPREAFSTEYRQASKPIGKTHKPIDKQDLKKSCDYREQEQLTNVQEMGLHWQSGLDLD
jgi:hypothetical protein